MPVWPVVFDTSDVKSFLLLVSLAFISIGSKPSSLATRWAAVVLPMPGAPEMTTAR